MVMGLCRVGTMLVLRCCCRAVDVQVLLSLLLLLNASFAAASALGCCRHCRCCRCCSHGHCGAFLELSPLRSLLFTKAPPLLPPMLRVLVSRFQPAHSEESHELWLSMLERRIGYVSILLLVRICGGAKLSNLLSQLLPASCTRPTTNKA